MMIVKKAIFSTILMGMVFSAQAETINTGCEAKKEDIRKQIDYARTHGNTHRISGLEKALSEVNENCTDASLMKERQAKVAEKRMKVTERQTDLQEARETGNQEKINKKLKKLNEAEMELEDAKLSLSK
jgi:hypothetical protein